RALARVQGGPAYPFYDTPVSGLRPDLSRPGAQRGAVIWAGSAATRRLALTFDDGPHPNWTPRVLAALARHNVKATFFVRGDNLTAHGDLLTGTGHEVANHTWDHPDLAAADYRACRDQLSRTSAEIARRFGRPPALFRPPYGHLGGAAMLAAAELGLTTVLWSAQMRESRYVAEPAGIVGDIAANVGPGAIILAHDTGPADRLVTIDHLDDILTRLRDDGYALTTVSELAGLGQEPTTAT
ncbi:MAG TPA: polysaccharide deacetylase family protein, partial [Candidatus Lustribacter sp.]|nr:polysaccharide deacetylase family protein [Candidatus Lustribacter sp.]